MALSVIGLFSKSDAERIGQIKARLSVLELQATDLYRYILEHSKQSPELIKQITNLGLSVGVSLISVNPIIGGAVALASVVTDMIAGKRRKDLEEYRLEQIKILTDRLASISVEYQTLEAELIKIQIKHAFTFLFLSVLIYIIFK